MLFCGNVNATDVFSYVAFRGRQARLVFQEQKKLAAVLRLQSLWRGIAARKHYHSERKRIVIVQNAVRRYQARAQLKILRAAARSASHFKEVSYKLENKVVELTQALQRRTAENKEQHAKIKALEESLKSWIVKHDDVEAKTKDMIEEHRATTVALPEFEALAEQKKQVDDRLKESLKKITDQDAQLEKLMADLTKQTDEIEARQKSLNFTAGANGTDESSTVGMLRAELASLREQLTRASSLNTPKGSVGSHPRDIPPSFNMALGRVQEQSNGMVAAASGLQATPNGKRRNRRGSVPQIYPSDSTQASLPAYEEFQPKAFSVANFHQDTLRKLTNEEELDLEALAEEIIKLLEEEKPLDEDVLVAIITNLRIPLPSSTTPPAPKEVLFPAHLISLITNEMWKYGMLRESERFLANVMQTVQQHVMVRCSIVITERANSEGLLFNRAFMAKKLSFQEFSGFLMYTRSFHSYVLRKATSCKALDREWMVLAVTLIGTNTNGWSPSSSTILTLLNTTSTILGCKRRRKFYPRELYQPSSNIKLFQGSSLMKADPSFSIDYFPVTAHLLSIQTTSSVC